MPDSPKPIKVVQVIARMNVGGPALLIDIVHRSLDAHEFDARLWTGDVEPGEIEHLLPQGSFDRVRKIDGLGRSVKLLGDVTAFVALIRLLRAERPDIVHTHTAKAGVLGRLAALVARIPVRIHTFHGHVLRGYFSPKATQAVTLLERLLAKRTTTLVAVGTQVRDDLLSAGIGRPEQYRVIPPGLEISAAFSKSESRETWGIPHEAPVILYVGRLTGIKRPDRLLEAMSLVLQRRSDAILVIVGHGTLFDEITKMAEPLGDSVRFLGWQSDLSRIYPMADVVVLTSDNEGMPLTLVEASMLGIPCVTTDAGSAREVVLDGSTGLVVAPNGEDVADALIGLLADSHRLQRFGSAAQTHAQETFGSAQLVTKYESLYRDLSVYGR